MNILVCGAKSSFSEQIMNRLAKEGHEVYHLTGSSSSQKVNAPVFQEFRLPFISESVHAAVPSARPDAVVIMGAYDKQYSWVDQEKEALDYLPGLSNVLTAARGAGAPRIVYLSTINVFEANAENLLTTQDVPQAHTSRAKTLILAEKLCQSFASKDCEVVVVRLPEIFGARDDVRIDNVCLQKVEDYLFAGEVHYTPNKNHCAMYLADAADVVFRIAMSRSQDIRPIMQFLGFRFTEERLIDVLKSEKWNESARFVEDDEEPGEFPLGNIIETHDDCIGAYMKFKFVEAINLLCEDCLKTQKEEKAKKRRKINWLPFVETVVLCIIAHIAQVCADGTWVGENFNFYIIYVLILGVSYGTSHGLFAAVLAGFCSLLLATMHASIISVLTDFGFFLSFLELVLVGVISGYLKDKFQRRNTTLKEENDFISNELGDVTRVNESNIYVKNLYEKRLVEYHNSLARIYDLTSRLDFLTSQKVIFQAVQVVRELMEVDDVAIYIRSGNSEFFRLAASSTPSARVCGKSIRYNSQNFIYDAISQGDVYKNLSLEADRPTFASSVDSDGEPIALVFVWAKEIEQINLYQTNILALLCRLIAKSMERAYAYEQALWDRSYIPGTRFMHEDGFMELLGIFQDGESKELLSFVLLTLDLSSMSLQEASTLVRGTDVFGCAAHGYWAILSNTDESEAHFVIDRLQAKGVRAKVFDHTLLRDPLTGENLLAADVQSGAGQTEVAESQNNDGVTAHDGTASDDGFAVQSSNSARNNNFAFQNNDGAGE